MRTFKILVIGEALVDQFGAEQVLGGAPFNLARHLAGLSPALLPSCRVNVDFVTRVGADSLGDRIVEDASSVGLNLGVNLSPALAHIQKDAVHHTGVVRVSLDAGGSPSYRIAAPAAWDFIEAPPKHNVYSMVCFSSLALRNPASRKAILETLDAYPNAIRFFDLNLRATGPGSEVIEGLLSRSTWLKVSDEELAHAAPSLDLPAQAEAAIATMHRRYGVQQTVLTRGAAGASLFGHGGGHVADSQGAAVSQVADTVGAGDSFSAAWLLGQIAGLLDSRTLQFANVYAAAVCGLRGPMPAIAERAAFFAQHKAALSALCATA